MSHLQRLPNPCFLFSVAAQFRSGYNRWSGRKRSSRTGHRPAGPERLPGGGAVQAVVVLFGFRSVARMSAAPLDLHRGTGAGPIPARRQAEPLEHLDSGLETLSAIELSLAKM